MAEISGPSSLPATPIPSTSSNYPFFESTGIASQDEDFWGTSSQASPGSRRCPTFKDFSEKIKQLQHENFQLKVRIYLNEQKTGVKGSSSDFTELLRQNMQHLQSALNGSNVSHSSSSNDVLSTQLQPLKSQNEQLNNKVIEMEQKIANYESALKDRQVENHRLIETNEDLTERLQDLETEFSITKAKLQQQINQAQLLHMSTANDYEVEKGAEIAFGGDHYDNDQEISHNIQLKLEANLADEKKKAEHFEAHVNRLLRKQAKSKEAITNLEIMVANLQNNLAGLEDENKKLVQKVMECSKVFVDLGQRNVELAGELQATKLAKERLEGNQSKIETIDKNRYENIRELVTVLQKRMKEIIAFVEALFKLESKNVFCFSGLQENSRKKIRKSMEQCQKLSFSLDEMFQMNEDSIMANRRMQHAGQNVANNNSISYNSHNYEDGRDFDLSSNSSSRTGIISAKNVLVQCDLTEQSLSGHSEKSFTKLQKDLHKSETKRKELFLEVAHLRSEIDSLQAKLRLAHCQIEELEKRPLQSRSREALEMKNKTLEERLTISDSALRKLHTEHAKLVADLRQMQLQNSASHEKSDYLDSERPSDSTSPDLGIDSGHDGATNSDDSRSTNYKAENKELRRANKELALKLNQTKQHLQRTVDKLNSTTKRNEDVEKAICRQLHRTHTILRQAKKSVEQYTTMPHENINIVPSS